MKISKKQKSILFYIGMLLLYTLAFWGVIKSWYMYDDIINYTSSGSCLNTGESIFELTKRIAGEWYRFNGRCFIFASYTYVLFSIVRSVYIYKFILVLITFFDGVLLSKIVGKITESKTVQLLIMVLFPCFIPLDSRWFNAMYGFHALMQMCFLWILLSIYTFIKYMDNKKAVWQILSCVFLSIALGTYEVAYVLCALFPVVAYVWTRKIGKSIVSIIPQTIIGVVWLGINVYARMQATSQYSGTTIQLGIDCVKAFFKQISGSWALSSLPASRDLVTIENLKIVIQDNVLRYFTLAIVMFVIFMYICQMSRKMKNTGLAFLVGVILIAGPSMLIAISQRYQQEVAWGKGYLPAFVSCWGIAVCGTIIFTKIKHNSVRLFLLVIPCIVLMVATQMVGDIAVSQHNAGNYDAFVAEAISAGVLEDVGREDILIEGTGDWIEVENFYAFTAQKRMNAFLWTKLYGMEENQVVKTDLFKNLEQKDNFFYTKFQKDRFYCLAECSEAEIFTDEQNNICRIFWTDNFNIFIPREVITEGVTYVSKEGQLREINFDMCEVLHTTKEGKLYKIKLTDITNAETITLQ